MMSILRSAVLACSLTFSLAGSSVAANAAEAGKMGAGEWFVRLMAEAPAENLADNLNLLGQLAASNNGYDRHDLEELAPFGSPYLTIVFPHPDWGVRAADYAVDYQSLQSSAFWEFVVRSDNPNRDVELKWDTSSAGEKSIFMYLIDTVTHTQIPARSASEYVFNMSGDQERLFVWVYNDGRLHAY